MTTRPRKERPGSSGTKAQPREKRATPKRRAPDEAALEQAGAKQAASERATPTQAASKRAAPKRAASKRAAPKRRTAAADRYTDPALRERLREQIVAGDKGGAPGQWSARKAQLLAAAYKKAGGGYRGAKADTQKHLDAWTAERWTTKDGQKARRGDTTSRYLPEEAWKKLDAGERKATEDKKRAGARRGRQFVPNTKEARRARQAASR